MGKDLEDFARTARLLLLESISEFEQERKDRISKCETEIKALVAGYGNDGKIALALVGFGQYEHEEE